jgi:hypothetical protein
MAYIREVLQGRLPDTTLAAFIRDLRVRLGIPPIREALLDLSIGRGDLEMPCPFECSGGKYSPYRWDPDVEEACSMCRPYGGKGTIPARELARWMSDPGYRTYYNTTSARKRRPFYEWSREKREQSEPKRAKLGSKDPDLANAYITMGLDDLRDKEYDLSTDEKADALVKRINKAYQLKSLINHPDKGGSHEAFLRLGAAFNKIRESDDKLKSRLKLKFGS